ARQVDRLHHGEPPIEPDADAAAAHLAGPQLRGQRGRGILGVLHDEVLHLMAAGDAHHGGAAAVREEADARRHHDPAPGCHDSTVTSSTRPGRPRLPTATIWLRLTPPISPSAWMRKMALPGGSRRPGNRPGTVGYGVRRRVRTTSSTSASDRPTALSTGGGAALRLTALSATPVTSMPS